MRVRSSIPALLVVAATFLGSCSKSGSPSTDPFYRDKGSFDYARLPLIKPYEVWYLNGSYDLLGAKGDVIVKNLLMLAVEGDLAYGKAGGQDVHVGGKTYKGDNNGDWFCLSLNGAERSWHQSEEALDGFLARRLGHKAPEPSPISVLFREFQDRGSCRWFPKPGANPQGGANGRQPSGSETNRTSAAAGPGG
jgi:hypothetical protein